MRPRSDTSDPAPDPAPVEDDLVEEFLGESAELLDRVDQELVALERDPGSRVLIASIFRSMHSMKGTAVCLGLSQLAWLVHAGENVLGRLREGELVVDAAIAGALLEVVDAVRGMLERIRATRTEGDWDHAGLLARLERFGQAKGLGLPMLTAESAASVAPNLRQGSTGSSTASVRVDLRMLDQASRLSQELGDALRVLKQVAAPDGEKTPDLVAALARVDEIAARMSDSLRRARMQPVGALWISSPRVVRDLALACGKKVRLETDGADIELDRTIVEAIKDPLTHLVRNAVVHGIESPEARQVQGKSPVGTIVLSARRSAGAVHVSIRDDGAGIDFHKVRQRAIKRGLLLEGGSGGVSEREALELIFLPGFSTADQVTQLSGRGVGLDVVKTNVQRAGGKVHIESGPGNGTLVELTFSDGVSAVREGSQG